MPLNPESRILNPLSRYWLLLGVTALAIAGLFSLVLVVARTPQLAALPMFADMFHKALVVHVDLSVLVWFLAMACMLWSLFSAPSRQGLPYIEHAALICFALATLAIAASAFDPRGQALMSNYIPVITSPVFFMGLGLLLCGVGLMLISLPLRGRAGVGALVENTVSNNAPLLTSPLRGEGLTLALTSAALIAAIALAAFVWSYMQMPGGYDPQGYYDLLFWGGGHVLQFVHVQVAMVVWLLLAKALKPEFSIYKPHLYILFSIGLIAALATPWAYLHTSVEDGAHRSFFTYQMILANGIAPTILALWILPGLLTFRHLRKGPQRALYSALLMSFVLFIYGGVLGALIEGQNVVIPAHYHGSIVGVTLAFMGAAYLYLPKFGYRDVSAWRLAYWQPIVYGIGQLMHISGLAWSGGYGVLRKTPGGMDALPVSVKAAMGFMGAGGTIAIIGGFMFVIVVWRAVKSKPS